MIYDIMSSYITALLLILDSQLQTISIVHSFIVREIRRFTTEC